MKKQIYHTGFLAIDRETKDKALAQSIRTKAKEAMVLYDAGMVDLVQKRISKFVYEYWMIPTKKGKRQGGNNVT